MIDGHVHYAESLGRNNLRDVIKKYRLKGMVLLCIPRGNGEETVRDAFDFQEQSDIPIYIMGGIRRVLYQQYQSDSHALSKALTAELFSLLKMGCNGVKMLEGKPDVRKKYPVPDFDLPVWEDYWKVMEERQIPLIFHVNDPAEFWDPKRVTDAARKYGWFYDESYINNQEQYRQIFEVLRRHPRLRVLFPHFFFLSHDLDRLSALLDDYPNVRIDITPGVELYYNLSAQIQQARTFFQTYQDRICFGTDIGARQVIRVEDLPLSLEESDGRMTLITRFLEEKGDYLLESDGYYVCNRPPTVMHGLGLSEEILKKIYSKNILTFLKVNNKTEIV